MSARFVPIPTEFCFARVEGPTELLRIRYVMAWFDAWMRFQAKCGTRGAVVFDIDDTLVDGNEERIHPVARAYRLCQEYGFRCCIVTARPESVENRRETMQMLNGHGVSNWESFYMMPSSIKVKDVAHISHYKRSCRDDIETRHRIVANVGDMWHDIVRFPLTGATRIIDTCKDQDCAVLFPPMSHGEVAIKLVAHVD